MSKDLLLRAFEDAQEMRGQEDVPEQDMGVLLDLLDSYVAKEADIEHRESELKEMKREHEVLRLTDIPSLMNKLGLVNADGKGSVKMRDGSKVYLRNDSFVSVYAADREAARAHLKQVGKYDACTKVEFSTSGLKAYVKELEERGVDPDSIRSDVEDRPLFKRYPIRYVVVSNRPIKTSGE